MKTFEIEFNKDGLVDLVKIFKEKLDPETQKEIAEAIEKWLVFKGVIGSAFEMIDGTVIEYATTNGVDALFDILESDTPAPPQ